MDELSILGRNFPLFKNDLEKHDNVITEIVRDSKFLVIGGGGTIGQAVTKELFKRHAKVLHVVDLNESYLAELVRDVRSSFLNTVNDFDTFSLDCGAPYFRSFLITGKYDYVLNLSAMKHVRSENSAFSMYRMFHTNVVNALNTYRWSVESGVCNYFCVSSDKATNPVNYMGATKRAMELCLMLDNLQVPISGARFANVAFSNGSILESFRNRISKCQPLSIPLDIERYFITSQEAGIICLFATVLCRSNEIFFPKNSSEIRLTKFKAVVENYLRLIDKTPIFIDNEEEAKASMFSMDTKKYWPVNTFHTDTVGEKPFEEFYDSIERVDETRFDELATINFLSPYSDAQIRDFIDRFVLIDPNSKYARYEMLEAIASFVPSFNHTGGEKFLNERM